MRIFDASANILGHVKVTNSRAAPVKLEHLSVLYPISACEATSLTGSLYSLGSSGA